MSTIHESVFVDMQGSLFSFCCICCLYCSFRLEATPHRHIHPRLTLLLRHTNGSTTATGGLGVLSSDPQTPVVTQTAMSTDLLQTLQILTQLVLHAVCQDLRIFAIDDIALSIKEPGWNLVLCGILDDGDDAFEFFGSDFTGAERYVSGAHEFGCEIAIAYRLFKSISAFLQTKFEYRRPTPLMRVNAYMIFSLPSTLVLRRRRMNWKFDFSPVTNAVIALANVSSFQTINFRA